MPNPVPYTDRQVQQIRDTVNAGVSAGKTKTEMFEQLSVRLKRSPHSIEQKYYKHNRKSIGTSKTKTVIVEETPSVPSPVSSAPVLSIQAAIGMLQAAEQFGFASSVQITFIS